MAEEVNLLAKRGPGHPKVKVEPKPAEVEAVADEKEIGDEDEVKLTGKELKALKTLLSKSKSDSQDGLVGALIEALRESQKPYKSEADKENERRQREQMKATAIRKMRNIELEQAYCKHMAGTNKLSDVPHQANAFTAIVWHDISNQLRWGICTVCQRPFWPTDPDYRYWRSKPSFNKASKAGDRDNMDMQTWATEEHPQPFGSVNKIDPTQILKESHALQF